MAMQLAETVTAIGWQLVLNMDIHTMVKHYQTMFKSNKDILDWIEHDLMHMGLSDLAIEAHLNEAKGLLETRS